MSRWSTACCHRADCADLHCPGRPSRPAPLITANSDGSSPRAPTPGAAPWAGWDWIDRLHTPLVWALLWVLVVCGSAASVLCLLLAYTGGSLCAR